MARHRRFEEPEEDAPTLDISSLIDCTFLLLLYFLVTTTIQKREADLDMRLPGVAPSTAQPGIEPKLIRVDASGQISVGAGSSSIAMDSDPTVRDLPLLRQDLESYANAAQASGSKPLIQLHVDGEAKQQRVIDVLNALCGAGITSVTFTDLVDP